MLHGDWLRTWLIVLCTAVLLPDARSVAQSPQYGAAGEVRPDNVGRLILRRAIAIDQRGGYAGAPVVDGDRLFVVAPFPHTVLAIDLSAADTAELWHYSPRPNGVASGLASTDVTTGGLVLSSGRLFLNTFDGHTIALDEATGRVLWDVAMTQAESGETLLAAPLVVGDRVYIGNSGSDFGARGWMAALDAASGRVLWKRYNTGPDSEVGIDSSFAAHDLSRDPDLGVRSWPPDAWRHGGGTLAGVPVYDAERGVLIHATGHPAPWNAEQRPGANYFTAGVFARDAATGAARWFVPINPHDLYGLGAKGSLIAADLRWQGHDRAVLIHPDANGMVYVLDRASGTILSANPFLTVNATEGVDVSAGELRRNPAKATQVNATTRDICPAWPGATGGTAQAAYSPQTDLLYIPASRLCMDLETRQANFIPGTPYAGANLRIKAPRGNNSRGALIAWNIAAGKPAWTIEESLPVESGVLATSGGIVFYGTLDGWFKATDARSGEPLWRFHAASGIIGQPVSFQRADGHQYIAVLAGIGGAAGAVTLQDIDIRDATAAHGYANAIRDLQPSARGGMLYIFSLP
jgi:PQQ-dependent dehydrogenase (methanol/ethanol family)